MAIGEREERAKGMYLVPLVETKSKYAKRGLGMRVYESKRQRRKMEVKGSML